MKTGKFTPKDGALAAGVALIGALVAGVGLSTFSTPTDANERIAAVEAKAAQAKNLMRPARNAQVFGPADVCSKGIEEQSLAIRQLLTAYGDQAGLQLQGVDIRPEYTPDDAAKLIPIVVRFEAIGGYEAAIGLLEQLSRERPQIFVDTLDLSAKTANVGLVFSGRLFCSV